MLRASAAAISTATCQVFLTVIGPNWLDENRPDGGVIVAPLRHPGQNDVGVFRRLGGARAALGVRQPAYLRHAPAPDCSGVL